MRRLGFLLLSLLFSASSLFAQWVSQGSLSSSHLYDVQFIGKQTGWIVGNNWSEAHGSSHPTYNTLFLRTTDAGATWLTKSYAGLVIWKFHFQSPTLGWAVGETDGRRTLIMKTSDGGLTWVVQDSSWQGVYISSVRFVDPLHGWAVGAHPYPTRDTMGIIYRTRDGGSTWVAMEIPKSTYLNDVFFTEAQRGFAVGESGCITRSTDGGDSWNEVLRISQPLRRVFFVGRDSGWAVGGISGSETKVRTTDGGETWQSTTVTGSSLHGLWFVDSKNGWTVGGANAGLVIERTTDGGVSWEKQPHMMGSLGYFEAVSMTDLNEGWVVGEKGMILKTTNSGVTSVGKGALNAASKFVLEQNYPNPFNPTTAISFQLSVPSARQIVGGLGVEGTAVSSVRLEVFDLLGRKVRTLVDGIRAPGSYTVIWDGRNELAEEQSSGIYFYILRTGDRTITKQMVLAK